jgi:CRP-like cAMP-binding protein
MMDSSLHALSNIQLLSDFDQDSLIQIQNGSLSRSYHTEAIVLWKNEPSPGIHLVRSGWLKAVRATITGREQVLSLFGPGDSFSVTSAFSNIPNPARVVSLEEVVIQIIPRELIFTLIDQHPDLSLKLIQRLSKSLAI